MPTSAAPEPSLDPDLFWSFSKVCAGLPNVKPRLAQSWLDNDYFGMSVAEAEDRAAYEVSGERITFENLKELNHETLRGTYVSRVVSPAGARLLVRLYKAGALDLKGKGGPGDISAELLAYCDSEAQLLALSAERAQKAQAQQDERQRYAARLKDLDSFQENEFSYRLLDDIFWANHGKGDGTLCIGSISVDKDLAGFTSNSGKSRDFRVTFRWTDADGERHELVKPSQYEENRRNDEDRNWGLGPE